MGQMNESALTEEEDSDRRRFRLSSISVRARILAALTSLAALALVVCGYTVFYLQLMQVEDRINAELESGAQEFVRLHEIGVDPGTGESFAAPSDLVSAAMQRIIPTRNEGVLGMVSGEVAYTSSVADVQLQDDQELVDSLRSYALADRAQFTTVETEVTTYRAVVVPVHNDSEVAAFILAYDQAAEKENFSSVFITYTWVAVFSLLVVALVGWLVAGRLLYPIRLLASTSHRITQEDLSERIPVTGKDDLAAMTRSVNEMLDRLEGAFTTQGQLIHDVSHELRTPLTIVRGHLEVLDAGDHDDVIATRELTLDELTRMNRVVDDLTTLAKADRPDFVQPAHVELGTLIDEVYDKIHALGDRRWLISGRAEGTVVLDRERITQALLQLAANAVKFSPPGSVVSLGSRLDHDAVILTVRDQGAGIPEEEVDRVFERFYRRDASQPGSGLGLVIVQAIAHAHSGTVRVESRLGAGSTFSIVLPNTLAPDDRQVSEEGRS